MTRLLNASLVIGAGLHASTYTSTTSAFHIQSATRSGAATSTTVLASTAETSRVSVFSDCDDSNTPPSLKIIENSILSVKSGSDIRGSFVDHNRIGTILNVAEAVKNKAGAGSNALTPLSAYSYGHAFAKRVIRSTNPNRVSNNSVFGGSDDTNIEGTTFFDVFNVNDMARGRDEVQEYEPTTICVGRDPRVHGATLADALCRGIESVKGVKAIYTGLASTPSMFEFCRAGKCDGSVMVTASHLPEDRNGFKFCTKEGGLSPRDIDILAESAISNAREWYDIGIMPPTSGKSGAVVCSSKVDFMPHYASTLRSAILKEVSTSSIADSSSKPLSGLRIVLNAGNGSGYFFNDVLQDLGADVSSSMNLTPDGTFPKESGVPNPEYKAMIDTTSRVCEETNADIGIMLDTDADRCGFVIPRSNSDSTTYEALNRNRLIALLSVIFQSSSPGCSIVTDSVTSEGLSKFLEKDLGLDHIRYVKGYANVIGKAKEITESGNAVVEMAIETSGHCAMKENGYLDDGTYTAVKVIGLLARVAREKGEDRVGHIDLLDLISNLEEMAEVQELRLTVTDGSILSTNQIFNTIANEIVTMTSSQDGWELDQENLEGVRVRNGADGSFFMLRKSLHDPVISLQVEGSTAGNIRKTVISPLLRIINSKGDQFSSRIDSEALSNY